MSAEAPLRPTDSVDRLRGVGPRLRATLEGEGLRTVLDLLLRPPRRYEDRTRVVPAAELQRPDEWVLVRGEVRVVAARRGRRRGVSVVEARLRDSSGELPVIWFNQPWVGGRLERGGAFYLYGPMRMSRRGLLQLVNPEVEEVEEGDDGGDAEGIVAVYRRIGNLGGRRIRQLVRQALTVVDAVVDPLSEDLRRQLGLPPLVEALRAIHMPPSPREPEAASRLLALLAHHQTSAFRRLAFDELLGFCCGVAEYRARRLSLEAPRCVVEDRQLERARRMLPFRLTDAQQRVMREIAADLQRSHPMARLLQGDVGSGKTVIAALAMLLVVDSGHQAALMAPTELLAEQHHRSLEALFAETGHRVELLTSSVPSDQAAQVRDELRRGVLRLVVGTHALIQQTVAFRQLGLVVVDEQHRFGVAQRQALQDKGGAPHLLVMTATPIPRSLALTVYGDLDLSVIDQLPPGRRPVKTVLRTAEATSRLYEFVRRELASDSRVFVVFPLIEPSEEVAARALEDHVDELKQELAPATVAVLHGRLGRTEREGVTERFRSGQVQVLLATTVVEVGVDVPEASVMVIWSAERFGLSQLHQLRGRVGRGNRASWCVLLMGEHCTEEARRRLEVFCRCQDGFEIAEADLELRGPGELTGTRQWGPSQFRFADLIRHRELVGQARDVARSLSQDGRLQQVRALLEPLHPIRPDLPSG